MPVLASIILLLHRNSCRGRMEAAFEALAAFEGGYWYFHQFYGEEEEEAGGEEPQSL